MSWTPDNIEKLKALWNDGFSCSQIATEIGPWCTRSAVIGKIHRLGLTERVKRSANPATRSKKIASTATPARNADAWRDAQVAQKKSIGRQLPLRAGETASRTKSTPTLVVDTAAAPQSRFVTLLDLDIHSCRWPIGEPCDLETFRYCGAPHADMSAGRPYCPHHTRIATGAGTPSERAAVRTASKVSG
jgi:GcrA cell cycle regulator